MRIKPSNYHVVLGKECFCMHMCTEYGVRDSVPQPRSAPVVTFYFPVREIAHHHSG